jgi:pimeloyl-ACP methyl ester carboxylesterase
VHIPEPRELLELSMEDGARIRVRVHGNPQGPRLLLSHGNGFAIDAYFPFWRLFLSDCEVVVYDQRNHGENPFHCAAAHTQARMAGDLEAVRRATEAAFGARKTAGAFHSLSTTVSLLHAARYGLPWDTLVLFDPPITPPPEHPLHEPATKFEHALSDRARKRPRRFASRDELAAAFKRTRAMRRCVADAAELMARAITRQTADGAYELVCPPELEASIHIQNAQAPVWQILPQVAARVFVISSDPACDDADPPGKVCAILPREFGIGVVPILGAGHLLQIEQPAAVEAVLRHHLRTRCFPIEL